MTPTPEQVEAARAEIKVALVGLSDRSTSPAFIAERLDRAYAALTAAAEVEPLYKMKGELDPETHRLWRAINGLDIDDFDKRAEAFVHSMLDGLTVGPGNRATLKSALAENFEQLAKDRTAAAEVGEPISDITNMRWHEMKDQIEELKKEVAATIERCAQVAESTAPAPPITATGTLLWERSHEIAAAIRALKDK